MFIFIFNAITIWLYSTILSWHYAPAPIYKKNKLRKLNKNVLALLKIIFFFFQLFLLLRSLKSKIGSLFVKHYKVYLVHIKKKTCSCQVRRLHSIVWLEALKNKTTRKHRRCELEEAFTVFYDWRHLKKIKIYWEHRRCNNDI